MRRSRSTALAAVLTLGVTAGCGTDRPVVVTAVDGQVVRVTMDDRAFSVDRVDVRVGQTVIFEFANKSSVGHEAYIGSEDAQDHHGQNRKAPQDAADTVELAGGDVARLTHTFTTAGDVIVGCHVAGHYRDGMKFTVHVS